MIELLHSQKTFCAALLATTLAFSVSGSLVAFADSTGANVRFPDARDAPPPSWSGPVFRLSQDYPIELPAEENLPWKTIDPKTEPQKYLEAVLSYAREGADAVDWDGSNNAVRKWYNAPWMHWGKNGREYIHGLTYERVSPPGELSTDQTLPFQNWAIGFYNSRGAYTIGRVWKDPNAPSASEAVFPEGTVSIKLLFTEAPPQQVPYLIGSKEWDAHVYSSISMPTNPFGPREVKKLHLLQIDVAVKDRRSTETGWFFGTFVYNGLLPGQDLWSKLVPVGAMWGDDPDLTVLLMRTGRVPAQEWISNSKDVPFQHLGWAGRLNGPVDNPNSSCLSCHGTAQWPVAASLTPPRGTLPDSVKWMTWFRNIKGGSETFSPQTTSLDYSLQLASGISNFYEWKRLSENRGGNIIDSPVKSKSEQKEEFSFPVGRDGGDN